MGGTFNPIHLAHIEMARCALKQKKLDEVWFMPSKIPPHKSNDALLDERVRAEMVKLAIEDEQQFVFSDFELKRDETTYTAKTLELLHDIYPETSWYFIMGGDSLFSFDKWYHPEIITKYAGVLAVSRDGVDNHCMQKQADLLSRQFQSEFCVLQMRQMNISSSQIRDKIAKKLSIESEVPYKVNMFIKNHKLYQ